jgi:predicted amidohydrolase
MIRFAVAQFEIGTDVAHNLATCLRMIDTAAHVRPQVLVLPEFCNHLSWYRDRAHSWEVAVELDGAFMHAIGDRAKAHGMYIMVNCTVRRQADVVTGTNVLFDPQGAQIAVSDKQVLMGNENNFLSIATTPCPIVSLPFARIGMYSCMDGVIYETPRGLAVRGAQVLLNSLNSFALDEASLHVPVRASENKVFVVAANKVGWLVPPELAPMIAERVKVAAEQLHGAGESQIVAPDGTVLAKAPHSGEAVVYADLDPAQADDKTRPDGTHIMASRRPRLYAPIAQAPTHTPPAPASRSAQALVWHAPDVAGLLTFLAQTQADLVVLPELWGIDAHASLADQAQDGERLLGVLQGALKGQTHLALSVVEACEGGFAHTGVLLNAEGVRLRQRTLHACGRHAWANALADTLVTVDTPFGRLALMVGGDTIYPEAFRLAALAGAHVVACPTRLLEAWEARTGLPERAAENRLNVCVADANGQSLILAVGYDFTLWTTWETRPFDGNISAPIVTPSAGADYVTAPIYPDAARNRMVSQKTDVVDSRPYALLEALV